MVIRNVDFYYVSFLHRLIKPCFLLCVMYWRFINHYTRLDVR